MKFYASGEDYLEAILVLQRQTGMVRSVDVARQMGVSKPRVCHAVLILKEGAFLTMDKDFFLHLTDLGREVAEPTYEKHRFPYIYYITVQYQHWHIGMSRFCR